MTYLWRKQFLKACAFSFTMKSVCDIWPYTEHEPLGFFISPLIRHEPWNLRGTKPVVDLEAALREVSEDDYVSKGHLVREFLLFMRWLEGLSEGMVRGVLQAQSEDWYPIRLPADEEGHVMMGEEDDDRFEVARPGTIFSVLSNVSSVCFKTFKEDRVCLGRES
jgi:hypothetical protein